MKQNTHIFSKFDLLGQVADLVKYLIAYYSGQPIRVNPLSPGGVYNGKSEELIQHYSSRSIIGCLVDEDELKGELFFLIPPKSDYWTDENLIVDFGCTAW